MKVWIDSDEAYPVYFISTNEKHASGREIDVPSEKVDRWREIQAAYDEMQEELQRLSHE